MQPDVLSNRDYWNNFYKELDLSVPSQFGVMVATECDKGPTIVELGCGNGRDSLFFAGQGHNVCAIDLSKEAVKSCRDAAEKHSLDNVYFLQGSIAEFDDLETLFAKARGLADDGSIVAYSRFVMHSINDEQRFVETDKFVHSYTNLHGFVLSYKRTGQGMAKYKSEDPYVSRLVFEKR